MKDTAPVGLGIIVVAGLFGFIAAGVALVVFQFGLAGAVFLGGVVGVIAAIVLSLGWRAPQDGATGPRDLSPDPAKAQRAGTAPTVPASSSKPASTAPNTATAVNAAAASMAAKAAAAGKSAVASVATKAAGAGAAAASATTAAGGAASQTAGTAKTETAKAGEAGKGAAEAAAGTAAENATADKASSNSAGSRKGAAGADKVATSAPKTAKKAAGKTAEPVVSDEDKPDLLTAARDGGPDDLKRIKGVGPKLEALLHKLGVFHFDQVASWGAKEVAWVDQNLEGFKGRVSRDNWVAQAKTIARGE